MARLAGAPKVQGAGVDLARKLGEQVAAGDLLYTVYADFAADLSFARKLADKASGYSIGRAEDLHHEFVEF